MPFSLETALTARKQADIQRSYLWRMELPALNFNTTDGNNRTVDRFSFFQNSNITVPDNIDISNRIKAVTVPYINIETDKEKEGNTYWYYAKKNDIGTITLEVQEYTDGKTFTYFDAWTKLITTPQTSDNGPSAGTVINNTNNPPIFYKFDLKFYRLDTTRLDLYADTYSGFFVSEIGEVAHDYENAGFMSYSVTLVGDGRVKRDFIANKKTLTQMNVDILNQTLDVTRKFGQLTTDELKNIIGPLGSTLI